jgi:Zn-finger nucleic acid-binding protein
MTTPCPHCSVPLVASGQVLGCTQCRGAWVPAAELDTTSFATGTHATVRCPICERPTAPVVVAKIEIDRCADHGAWFDAGELARLREAHGNDGDQGGRNVIDILVGFFTFWF